MNLGIPRNFQDNSRNTTGFPGISDIHLIRDLYQVVLRDPLERYLLDLRYL